MPSWLQPTSPVILILAGVLLLATLAWTLVWIPIHRHPRRGRAIGQQSAAVLTSIVVSMAMIFLVLNTQSSWFTTWSSISGFGTTDEATIGAPAEVGDATQTDPAAVAWQNGTATDLQADPRHNPAFGQQNWAADTSKGQYLTVTIPGPASGHEQSATVWLPPSYLDHPERFYPVLIGFSGVPGSVQGLIDALQPGELVSTLSSQNKLRESIIVIPDVFPDNVDTECVDASDGSVLMETFVATDVVNWIRTNLRADSDRGGWATFGFSAGGWVSSMITMRHPDVFGASINMSGYFEADFEGPQLRPEGDTTYDLGVLATDNPPDVDLWFTTAKDDPMPYNSWQAFSPKVVAPTSLTTQLVETGGHNNPVWVAGLEAGFGWLGSTESHFGWQAA